MSRKKGRKEDKGRKEIKEKKEERKKGRKIGGREGKKEERDEQTSLSFMGQFPAKSSRRGSCLQRTLRNSPL